jgi:MFS family permease
LREGEPDAIDDTLVDEARQGWETARERHAGIETRASTFVQVAGLTTTVVLVNSTLLKGNDPVTGGWRSVFLVAVIVASVCLLVAGTYGLYATMRTFGRVAPDNVARILERTRIPIEARRRISVVATLLVAARRTSIVADWKLARLKRASFAFGAAVLAIAVASVAFVAAAQPTGDVHSPDGAAGAAQRQDAEGAQAARPARLGAARRDHQGPADHGQL